MNNKYLLWIFVFIIMTCNVISYNKICIQNNANETSSCADRIGTYEFFNVSDSYNFTDDDYSTSINLAINQFQTKEIRINYTKPTFYQSNLTPILNLTTSSGSFFYEYIDGFEDTDYSNANDDLCSNYYDDKISIRIQYYNQTNPNDVNGDLWLNVSCYNGTWLSFLESYKYIGDEWKLSEEKIKYFLDVNYTVDNCINSSYVNAYNFSIKDEDTGSLINADVTTATFNYNYDGIYKTYSPTYTNINNFSVCVYPSYTLLNGNITIFYEGDDHYQRRYYDTSALYDNPETLINLYLLNTSQGIYIRFRTTDTYDNVIANVDITMATVINGTSTTVEQESSDDSGIATFFVDPDKDYTFTFTKTGYLVVSYSLRPTTSEVINVQMPKEAADDIVSYSSGITLDHTPTYTTLNNDTSYDFTVNMTTSYWKVTKCLLIIYNGSTSLNTSSGIINNTFCSLSTNLNTVNYTDINLILKYELNSTINQTYTISYSVLYEYEGTGSLKNFLNSVNNFRRAGFDDFTASIIGFVIIFFMVAGVISGGIENGAEDALIILFLGAVFIFSYAGWFRINYEAMPSILGLQQYFLFYILLLVGVSYLLNKHMR